MFFLFRQTLLVLQSSRYPSSRQRELTTPLQLTSKVHRAGTMLHRCQKWDDSRLYYTNASIAMCICDVISENLSYGGTNNVGLGQTPRVMRAYKICLLMSIYSEYFCRTLCNFTYEYYHNYVKTADLGGHCLFLYKAGFRRWRHILKQTTVFQFSNKFVKRFWQYLFYYFLFYC